MKAGVAFTIAALMALTGGAAYAQTQPQSQPATSQQTPPADAVGPRELRDFSLPGTVTRPAETPPSAEQPAPATSRPAPTPAPTPAPSRPATGAPTTSRDTSAQGAPAGPARSVTVQVQPEDETGSAAASEAAAADSVSPGAPLQSQPPLLPAPLPPAASMPAENDGSSSWLWVALLAAAAIGSAAVYLATRQRRQAVAGASRALETFVPAEPRTPPEPPPAPAPAPAPQFAGRSASATPASPGLVSARLRPWIELEFTPLRCIVEPAKATIEFEVSVTNSGSAIARDLLIEAMMFNAGPAQDQEIAGFFANPFGKGDAVPALAPLKGMQFKSSVNLPVEQLRVFQVAGRQLIVPLIGFNALYRWGGGQGQTSRSYLVGREGEGEKMAPFRMDLGPRLFRNLGAREHHVHVRQ
ncbi:MAG: hypothetical protein ACJ8EY_11000 [Sphingomicrobium sp.]